LKKIDDRAKESVPKIGWEAGLPDGTFSDQIWVILGGSCNGRCWYILWPFGLFYGHLVYIGTFFPVLVSCTKITLATLMGSVTKLWEADLSTRFSFLV
jgi:hypothetical protein